MFTVTKAQGDAKPSFMSYCLEKMDPAKNTEEQEQVIKETTATLYAGTYSRLNARDRSVLHCSN